MIDEQCATCRFYQEESECHRLPPHPIVYSDPREGLTVEWRFAETAPNEWCGEFKEGEYGGKGSDQED